MKSDNWLESLVGDGPSASALVATVLSDGPELPLLGDPADIGADGERLVLVGAQDDAVVSAMESAFAGRARVMIVDDGRRVLAAFNERRPDLVVLEQRLAGLDGLAVLRQLQTRIDDAELLPAIVVADDATLDVRRRALELGAADVLAKPLDDAELRLRAAALLRIRDASRAHGRRADAAEARLASVELDYVKRLIAIAGVSDCGGVEHVARVGRASALIAAHLGMEEVDVQRIRYAAPLHDIGNVAIPDAILLKPDALSLEEWDVLKTHTIVGAQICSGSRSPILQMAEEIALYHHDNWNGTGYTPGLEGDDIPLVGRIVAAADVFDTLTHERPYKAAWSLENTLEWMEGMRGAKFDPAVLDALLAVVERIDLLAVDGDAALEAAGRFPKTV